MWIFPTFEECSLDTLSMPERWCSAVTRTERPAPQRVFGVPTWFPVLMMAMGLVPWTSSLAAPLNYDRRSPIVEVVQRVGPAVVNISTETLGEQVRNPFDELFFFPQSPRYSTHTSIGSGLIFSEEGYVVTNAHVIEKAVSAIKVTTIDGKEYRADLVGSSRKFDLAVLKLQIPRGMFSFHPLGCSDDVLIGETVIAIGNSLGLSHTVTSGIVSAVNRSFRVQGRLYRDFIQTDASINPGNSGGPLLNVNATVIGINTAIYEGSEGIGFAIPANTVQKVVSDLLEYGETRSPWLGIFVQDVTPMLREYMQADGRGGVVISELFQQGPGAKAGLQAGDLILQLNGQDVAGVEDYKALLSHFTYKEDITIRYWRNGETKVISLRGSAIPQDLILDVVREWLGLEVVANSRELAAKYRLPDSGGIVVSKVSDESRAKSVGIEPGDIIWQVNQFKVKDLPQFRNALVQAMNENDTEVSLVIQRGRRLYYVGL